MPTLRVDVNPEIFNWVIQNINIDNIKEKSRDQLFLWQNRSKLPTFNQLEEFSATTNIPFGYFFLNTPPEEKKELLEYRTVDSLEIEKPSRNLIDTINDMEYVQEWMRKYIKRSELSKLDFVGTLKDTNDINKIASVIRARLDLSKEWYLESSGAWDSFKLIRKKLESIGIIVMMNGIVGSNTHRPLSIQEFRAFTLIDEYAPLIFINAKDSANGRLFSLVHEIAHIWFGVNSFYNDYNYFVNQVSSIEMICNAVAAELLVPVEIFNCKWEENKTTSQKERINDIANYFRCGTIVVARKALDEKLINRKTYTNVVKEAIENYKNKINKKNKGGDSYNNLMSRLDKRLVVALKNSVYEGETEFTEAYMLTNTSRKTFSELVKIIAGTDV